MKNYFCIFLLLLLFSCSENPHKELVITFDSSAGLEEGDDVVLKGQTIGEVTKISLNEAYKAEIEIYLDKIDRLPKDSKFVIGIGGLFSNALYVSPGKSTSYLTRSDKIIGNDSNDFQLNGLIDQFIEKLPEPAQKEDSVLIELRGIKKEVQEVNEKTK